jgi:hypothetical protein
MLGLHLLVVTTSARLFVPAVQSVSGHAAESPLSRPATPRVAPVVAIAPDVDELILPASLSAGMAGGIVALVGGFFVGLLLGVTFRQKDYVLEFTSKFAKWPSVKSDTSPAVEATREPMATAAQKMIFSDASRFPNGDPDMEDPLRPFKQVITELEWSRDWEWPDTERLKQREAALRQRQAALDAESDEIRAKIADIRRKMRSSESDDKANEWGLG